MGIVTAVHHVCLVREQKNQRNANTEVKLLQKTRSLSFGNLISKVRGAHRTPVLTRSAQRYLAGEPGLPIPLRLQGASFYTPPSPLCSRSSRSQALSVSPACQLDGSKKDGSMTEKGIVK